MVDWRKVFDKWVCPKCGCSDVDVNEHAFTGSGFTRLIDLQCYEYLAVTCRKCGYTEFYSKAVLKDEETAFQILDLILGK
ncbi:MAG: zinc ribbon domain-containing protein [archaeon GB-1867-005]|nr:zinc ribbon domain-containing protein [Candidatus Culexmicrobium cathedralense]